MRYEVEFKPRAVKDLKGLPPVDQRRVLAKIEAMTVSPEYRLRVGNYRVLFEIEANKVVIYRVRDRKDVYS